jgi:hypothetical protein
MNYKHASPVSQTMNGMFLDTDVAIGAVEFAEQIVVIPGDVNNARALARFAQNLLNDVIMLLGPVNPAPQLPDVDQIAHNVQSLEVVIPQESSSAPALAPRVPKCTSEIQAVRTRRTEFDSVPAGSKENRDGVKIGMGGNGSSLLAKSPPGRSPDGLSLT